MKKAFKKALLGLAILLLLTITVLSIWILKISRELPSFDAFLRYRPQQTGYFLSRNGEILGCVEPADGWRDVISQDKADSLLVAKIVVAVEDRRFFERNLLIDFRSIFRALWKNMEERRIVEGGSTIPQQLVKQLLPPEERSKKSLTRKVKELILAWQVTKARSKKEILAIYVNEVSTGHNRHGVEAASLFYFNKHADKLSLSESALLAGLLKAPAIYSPKNHPDRAKFVRNQALAKAYEAYGPQSNSALLHISEEEYMRAHEEEIRVTDDFEQSCNRAPHAIDFVRKEMREKHGIFFDNQGENPGRFGLRVELTLDEELQNLANQGVRFTISEYEKRQGEQAIDAEGALVVIENETGAIIALVGGKDYKKHQYNHAVQAKRQIGSAFKVFVYLAKLEKELSEGRKVIGQKDPVKVDPDKILDYVVSNEKISCRMRIGADPNNLDDWWKPKNYDEKKYSAAGYTRRFALAQSINRPAVHTAHIGGCRLDPRIIWMAQRLGLNDPIPPYLPSALGASSHALLDVTRAYSVIPARGFLRPNYLIQKISNAYGNVYFEKKSIDPGEPVISETLARVMVEALRGAVQFGTAVNLSSLTQPTACKTGTTNNFTDALIFCFTPDITLGVWIGGPESYEKSLGDLETGARLALPAAKVVLENKYKNFEPRPFLELSQDWQKLVEDPDLFKKEQKELQESGGPSEN